MSQRPTIRQQIDACRPDSDDPHLSEHSADLSELSAGLRDSTEVRRQYERSQHNDRLIRSAMHDVSLPAGLEERLFAAMKSAPSAPLESAVQQAASQPAPASPAATPAGAFSGGRRWFIRAAGTLAGTAALVAAIVLGPRLFSPHDQRITKEQLARQVEDWLQTANRPDIGNSKATSVAVNLPHVLGRPGRSRSFTSKTESLIVAYDLALDGSSDKATLLVIKTSREYPVGTLPYSELNVSGGMSVGAWQRDGVLYILAVHGDSRLDRFLKTPTIG